MRIILWSCFLLLSSCGDTAKKETPASNSKEVSAKSANPVTNAGQVGLPSITLEEMQILYDQADYIDLIFYNMNFSMSVNDKPNVKRVVTFVDKTQPNPNFTCPTMGRIIFQKDGEILIEADMHIDKHCSHFVFFKNGKKAFANNISEQGKGYFNKIFSQVKVAPAQ